MKARRRPQEGFPKTRASLKAGEEESKDKDQAEEREGPGGSHSPSPAVPRSGWNCMDWSSKQNDRISFQVAKDHHWFHADGVPGSHCLLLLQPGEEASDAALHPELMLLLRSKARATACARTSQAPAT